MLKTQTQINAEVRIDNLRTEINFLDEDYAMAIMDVTKKVIMDKIDLILEEIDELKEVL